MTLTSHVFWKLQTVKDVVRQTSKKYRFKRRFNKRRGKWSKTLLKSEGQHLYHLYKTTVKVGKTHLGICNILGLFVNTFIADDKYSLLNTEDLK